MTPFGKMLTYYRACAGLTLGELAQAAELSSRFIEYLVSGQRRVTEDTVDALATALGLSEHDLMVLLAAAAYPASPVGASLNSAEHQQTARGAVNSFPEILKHYRRLVGLSQSELANRLGIEDRYVQLLESGNRRAREPMLRKLNAALGLSEHDRTVLFTAAAQVAPPGTLPGLPSPAIYDPEVPSIAGLVEVVGRNVEFAAINQRLTSSISPLYVALLGPPGVGKTTLAMQLAHDRTIRDHFVDGVLWARLSDAPHITDHFVRWAGLLGISTSTFDRVTSRDGWRKLLHNAMGDRRLLLIVDDAWSLQDALALCVGGTRCAFLVTTRFPALAYEWAKRDIHVVGELDHNDSIHLLRTIAPQLGSSKTHEIRGLEDALVDWVGGLPLALTLVGKHLDAISHQVSQRSRHSELPGILADRLRDALRVLEDARERVSLTQTNPATGQLTSVQAVIAVSEEHLSQAERECFQSLAVFPPKPGTFSRNAALQVSSLPDQVLDGLMASGLLECSQDNRYTLHRTIYDFARMYGPSEAAERRMVHYYREFVEQNSTSFSALAREQHNVFEALEAAFRCALNPDLTRMIVACCDYLQSHGMIEVAEVHLLRAEQVARAAHDLRALVDILNYRARNADRLGHSRQAEDILRDALACAETMSEDNKIIGLLATLGDFTSKIGRYTTAEELLLDGLRLVERRGLHAQRAFILRNLSSNALAQGHYTRAMEYAAQGLAIARQSADQELISAQLSAMGNAAANLGRYQEAYGCLRECLGIAEALDLKVRMAYVHTNLGCVAINLGKYQEAEEHLDAAIHLGEETRQDLRIAFALANLAEVAIARGNSDRADALLQRALNLAERLDRPDRLIDIYVHLATLEIERGRLSRAQAYLDKGWVLSETVDDYPEFRALLLRYSGECSLRNGDLARAEEQLEGALAIGLEGGHPEIISSTRCALGRLCLKQGQTAHARGAFHAALNDAPEHCELVATAHFGLAQASAAEHNEVEARAEGLISLNLFEQMGHRRARAVRAWLTRFPIPLPSQCEPRIIPSHPELLEKD